MSERGAEYDYERSIARRHAPHDCGCAPCHRFPEEKLAPARVLDFKRWWPSGRPPAGEDDRDDMKNGTTPKRKRTEKSPPFTRDLECKLRPTELQAKKDRSIEALNEADAKEAELRELGKPLRDSIKKLRKESNQLRAEATKGTEVRPVNCVTEWDFAKNRVRVIRQDTRAIEEDRPMTSAERQEMLPLPAVPSRSKVETLGEVVDPEPII